MAEIRNSNKDTIILAKSCKDILKLLLHYPWGSRITYLISFVIYFCIWVFILDGGFIGFIIYYLDKNPFSYFELSDAFAGACSSISIHFYHIFWINTYPQIDYILKELSDFKTYEKPIGIENLNKTINLACEATMIWFLFSLLITWVVQITMYCEIEDGKCGFFLPAYMYALDVWSYPLKWLYSTLQMIIALNVAVGSFFEFVLMFACSEFLINRLTHLKYMLRMLKTVEVNERKSHIKKCVLYHYKILELHEKLVQAEQLHFALHVAICTLTITLTTYQLLLGFDYTNFAHGFGWFFGILIVCIGGERLITCSKNLSDVVYESMPWDGDVSTQNSMLFIMIRAQKPLSLPSGLFGDYTHLLLISVIKTSYSIITLLINSE